MSVVFKRFFISGLGFYIFFIWLNCLLLYQSSEVFTFVSNPTVIVLASLAIGFILNYIKFYRQFWTDLVFKVESQEDIGARWLKAFNIEIDNKTGESQEGKSNEKDNTSLFDILDLIEQFLKVRHPEKYLQLIDARAYPDVVISFLSWAVISSFLYPTIVTIKLFLDPSYPILYLLVPLAGIFLIGWTSVKGSDFLKDRYRRLNDYTEMLFREAYLDDCYSDGLLRKNDAFLTILERKYHFALENKITPDCTIKIIQKKTEKKDDKTNP